MIDLHAIASAITYEHQCHRDADAVLGPLVARIACMIADDRERASFVSAATMSGLIVPEDRTADYVTIQRNARDAVIAQHRLPNTSPMRDAIDDAFSAGWQAR
jgi:hypothetical protein